MAGSAGFSRLRICVERMPNMHDTHAREVGLGIWVGFVECLEGMLVYGTLAHLLFSLKGCFVLNVS